jgi:hypothetical protein
MKTSALSYTLIIAACFFSIPAQNAAADTASAVNDFSNVKVFPNPWRIDRHSQIPIKFEGLPLGSTVKLFTVSGHRVATLSSSGDPASAQWMVTNNDGDMVASGVYLYVITDSAGQKSRGKVAIIK